MPRTPAIGLFLVRFTMADGPHIASAHAPRYATEDQRAETEKSIHRALRPPTTEHPEGNPEIKITEIRLVKDPSEIDAAVAALKADPNRVGADQMGLDTPNRILHEPELTESAAANNIPG